MGDEADAMVEYYSRTPNFGGYRPRRPTRKPLVSLPQLTDTGQGSRVTSMSNDIVIAWGHEEATEERAVILRNGKRIGFIWEPHKMDGKRDIYLQIPGLDVQPFVGSVDNEEQAVKLLTEFFA